MIKLRNLMGYLMATRLQRRKLIWKRKKRRKQKKKKSSSVVHESEMMFRLRSVTWEMDAGLITISRQKFKLDSIAHQKL